MAKYSSFKYGQAKYDATSSSVLLWTFMVDWDGDGMFDGTNEAPYMVDLDLTRGRDYFLDGNGFGRYRTGTCTIILDNSTQRYNPYNTSSPLYPNITPGKKVRIAVKEGSNNHSLMRGKIADIQPFNVGNKKMVRINIVDGQEWLSGNNLRLGMRRDYDLPYYGGLWTTGSWFYRILDGEWPSIEWPVEYDVIDDYNNDTYQRLPYAWFWDVDALRAIRELEDAELGTFLHSREGTARFLSRKFTYDKEVTITQQEVLTDVSVPQPWETLRNKVEIAVHPIAAHSVNTILWQIGGLNDQAILVEAEGSFVTDAVFRYFNYTGVPVSAGTYPFYYGPTVSFTVNSSRDGTGTNLTSQCSVQLSEIADGATVILLNSSGTDGYITNLQVSGDVIFSKYRNNIVTENSASKAIYDSRVMRIDSPWQQDSNNDLGTFLLTHLSRPKPYPTIILEKRPTIQFNLDLYVDRVRFTSEELSVDGLFRIGQINHKWTSATGDAVRTTLKLEPWFAYEAPAEYNYTYLNTFASSAETDCSGSPATGKMEWCFDPDGGSSNYPLSYWYRSSNIVYLYCSQTTADEAELITTGLSYPITSNSILSFDYQWSDSNPYTTTTDIYHLRLTTDEGVVYDEAMPVIVSAGASDWTQFALDLSPYGGQTLTEIAFVKNPSFISSDPDLVVRIDNVGLGIQLYP